jgi:sulfite dehydrogenase (cytochrome) subunit B
MALAESASDLTGCGKSSGASGRGAAIKIWKTGGSSVMRRLLVGGMIAISASTAWAEEGVMLKDAPGREIVERYCGTCHSLDYVGINAGFLNRMGWQSEVDKMIKAYGAPIGAGDAKTIVEYLTANYGSRE